MAESTPARWTAIVLAGQRPSVDPLAEACGQTYKALIQVSGRSMLSRVCGTLLMNEAIARVVILSQEPAKLLTGDAANLTDEPKIALADSGGGIAQSIAEVAGTAKAPWPVLVTTADHALLDGSMIDEFLAGIGEVDLAIGVGERRIVERAYPETTRTWLKFSDGHYSGANLFALRNASVGAALELWSGVEQDRKKSLSIMSRFGPLLLLRALTRTISFPEALRRAGLRLGVTAKPVVLSQAEAVIDVDKLADLKLVEEILTDGR